MKIMALNNPLGTSLSSPIAVDIIPDSAVIKDHKPFFVPDFSEKWVYELNLAIRVNRLGKNVGEKFAPRYYDAFTICLRMKPLDMIENLSTSGVYSGIATAFDGAVILGDWQPLELLEEQIKISIGEFETTIESPLPLINNTIKQLSKFFTFKIGDILIPATLGYQSPFNIDDVITGKINDIECLNLRIK